MRKKEMKVSEALAGMRELVDTLSDDERARFTDNLTLHTYKRSDTLFEEGGRPLSFFFLLAGKVKLYKTGAGGRKQIVSVYRPGQYFGYRAYFAGQNHALAAAAIERSTVAEVSMKTFSNLVRDNAALAYLFVRRLSEQLELTEQRAAGLMQKHIRGRLAESLLFLKKTYGLEEDQCTLSIYLSREDMASLSNMTTANAIRTLSQFATEKIIAIDGRKIKIIDEKTLEKISETG